jgi:hypothetical protein
MSELGKDENGSCFGCLVEEIVTPIRHPRRKNWGHLNLFESIPAGKENNRIGPSAQVILNGGK